jgi:hypothetical protein
VILQVHYHFFHLAERHLVERLFSQRMCHSYDKQTVHHPNGFRLKDAEPTLTEGEGSDALVLTSLDQLLLIFQTYLLFTKQATLVGRSTVLNLFPFVSVP